MQETKKANSISVKTRHKIGFWLLVLAICGAALMCLTWMKSKQEASKASQLASRVSQLKLALENYHYVNGYFPNTKLGETDGPPRVSWRVQLLPMIELEDIFRQYSFDKSWNSPENLAIANALGEAPSLFRSPFSKNQYSEFADFVKVEPFGHDDESDLERIYTVTRGEDEFSFMDVENSKRHWMMPDN